VAVNSTHGIRGEYRPPATPRLVDGTQDSITVLIRKLVSDGELTERAAALLTSRPAQTLCDVGTEKQVA
jgi:hypothetical protein